MSAVQVAISLFNQVVQNDISNIHSEHFGNSKKHKFEHHGLVLNKTIPITMEKIHDLNTYKHERSTHGHCIKVELNKLTFIVNFTKHLYSTFVKKTTKNKHMIISMYHQRPISIHSVAVETFQQRDVTENICHLISCQNC